MKSSMKLRIVVSCDCFPVDRFFSFERWYNLQQELKKVADGYYVRERPCALCGHQVSFKLAEIMMVQEGSK